MFILPAYQKTTSIPEETNLEATIQLTTNAYYHDENAALPAHNVPQFSFIRQPSEDKMKPLYLAVATLAYGATASVRIGYRGSDRHAIPETQSADAPIIFTSDTNDVPGLDMWDFTEPVGPLNQFQIRNTLLQTYIYCDMQTDRCALADEGTWFELDSNDVEADANYVFLLMQEDNGYGGTPTLALTAGDYMQVGTPNSDNYAEWLSLDGYLPDF
ncbi:hypothetical protein AbraIFM66951_003056 [Aspergillus brasiliensis]|uniref:Uncharacterized protein n=1 Tax=Aspergillus brasiliensis TaxID=319629 RepID=A0A9W5YMW8_9EURO|nr:hypothetical protein AbraCBS73388_006372 [Aspergillus brasiliensis]GKZ42908.1 hypothetical protein AbraIFM66951_003056 [Aspergillus brasiliensis]